MARGGSSKALHRSVRLRFCLLSASLLALGSSWGALAAAEAAAETGDFDGDGRLSLLDVMGMLQGIEPAPGSTDAFDAYPCRPSWKMRPPEFFAAITYLESLRRGVPGSLPSWVRLWPSEVASAPLAEDATVTVELGGTLVAQGGDDDRVELELTLVTLAPVSAFSIILQSDGDILRVTQPGPDCDADCFDPDLDWSGAWGLRGPVHSLGDLPVAVSVSPFLITRGKYVMTYGMHSLVPWPVIPPGEYSIVAEARLPRGLAAGRHGLKLLEASEVMLEDSTLLRPTVVGEGAVEVLSDVTSGWDEGAPPLQVDFESQRIIGKVEYRVADANGLPVEEGKPVAQGYPGEEVSLRVQMRTETPLNWIYSYLEWPAGGLECAEQGMEGITVLLTNPEDGEVYKWVLRPICDDTFLGIPPSMYAGFALRGASASTIGGYRDRPLEYFKPLDTWMDVVELRLAISECARGGAEIPLVFRPYDPLLLRPQGLNEFAPYDLLYCRQDEQPLNWTYDVEYHPGVVKVLGSQPACGEPPPDLGVRVLLGDVTASPGETVEMPVFASAQMPMSLLRIALEVDPEAASVDEVDFEVYWEKTGEFVRRVVARGHGDRLSECDTSVPPVCWEGVPRLVVFRENADARFVHLDISPNEPVRSYPGTELHEIARLRVRVREDYEGVETLLKPAAIPYGTGPTGTFFETGGYMPLPDWGVFSPAREVRGGAISIRGRGFLRGDSNSDGKVDLSDAVATLGYLFLGGGTPQCMDTADADDLGSVEITDAISLLGVLFLGTGAIPQPYPDCGSDPTADSLGCERSCHAP